MALLLAVILAPWSSAAGAPSAPREPLTSVLGIAPGMLEAQAHRLLARIGERIEERGESEEEGDAGLEREVWRLRDRRYAWIELAVDARHRVKAVQAYLRRDGPGLRYAEIGDVGRARRLGYTILEWQVPARPGRSGRRVTARGADSVFAATVAIAAIAGRD